MSLASLAMGAMNLLDVTDPTEGGLSQLAKDIFQYISYILVPIMIVVGAAGIIYAVYLGVNLAKADSADKRQEAKARMVNAIIGFVAIFVLVLLMYLFVTYADTIFGWVEGTEV